MKNVNAAPDLRQQALGAIDKYLAFDALSGAEDIMQAVLGLFPGKVTEWESSAIFARDTIKSIYNKLLAAKIPGIDAEDMHLLDRIAQFFEEVHYEPRRRAEMEKAVLQGFSTAYDEEELTSMIEIYALRTKAIALETQLAERRNPPTRKAA